MTAWETKTPFDIAESGIFPMSARELIEFEPAEERERTLERLLDTRLGYSEAPGTLELRSLIAATYRDTGPEEILVTTGAIEANFLLFNVLLEPADHVVAVYPAYQQLYSVPRAIGCDVSLWKLRIEDGFRYNVDDLERLVTSRTKLIVINTPHNPTGAMLCAEDLRRIDRLASSVGARVLSDEAYRWLEIPGGELLAPPMRNLGSVSVSVGTLSKPFGLPGLRIGWIARLRLALPRKVERRPGRPRDAPPRADLRAHAADRPAEPRGGQTLVRRERGGRLVDAAARGTPRPDALRAR